MKEIKQIAGRAGRYNSEYPVGEVTALQASDLKRIQKAIATTFDNVPHLECTKAGLFPLLEQLVVVHEILGANATYVDILVRFVFSFYTF